MAWPSGVQQDNALLGNEQINVSNASSLNLQATVVSLVNFAGSNILAANTAGVSSSTTLVPSGLSANLQVGTYIFDVYLSVTNGSSGGLKAAPGGTATASLFAADTWTYNTTTVAAQGNITALSSNYVALTGSVTTVNITGTIVVSAAGTFTLQYAQNASNGTATVLNAGSYMWVERVS